MRHVSILAILLPGALAAQTPVPSTLGPSMTLMVNGGHGVHSTSCEATFFGAVGVNAARPFTQSIRLQIAARAYVLAAGGGACALMPLPPPPDGTYTMEDEIHLMAHGFGTTDARVDVDLPSHVSTLSAGGGVAWREGRNVPYVLAGLSIPVVDGVRHRFGLQIDYQWLHLTNDRFSRTFQGGVMTAEQHVGTASHWSNAVQLGVRWAFGL